MLLRVSEIFHSIQGEGPETGWPTVFVRLTGCPLRCRWCDTTYAFTGGQMMSQEAVAQAVGGFDPTRRVCVTGGEPLAQSACFPLVAELCDAGFDVSVETSGAVDASRLDPRAARVIDFKLSGSGEESAMDPENFRVKRPRDCAKLVIAHRDDYRQAKRIMGQWLLGWPVYLSPVWGELSAAELAAWVIEDRLDARVQVQLHKILDAR